MKIAVLSDIHGNLPALQTITADIEAWQPDMVVVNGDIINRGANSPACWQFVREKQTTAVWQLLRGNHEEYVLSSTDPTRPQTGPHAELRQFSDWTYQQIRDQALHLAALPDRWAWHAPDGSVFMVMHASVLGNRLGVYPDTTDEELRGRIFPAPAVFVTGHTHRALQRQIDKTLVINIGSAGLPFDGDWHVSYGRFTWQPRHGWHAEIRRLPYDRAQAERDLFTSGFMAEAGPMADLVLVELRIARGLIHHWVNQYQADFIAGNISLRASVDAFLDQEEFRPWRR
jgi:predicted phosphodiesterase